MLTAKFVPSTSALVSCMAPLRELKLVTTLPVTQVGHETAVPVTTIGVVPVTVALLAKGRNVAEPFSA